MSRAILRSAAVAVLALSGCSSSKTADMSKGGRVLSYSVVLAPGEGEGRRGDVLEEARKIALARLSALKVLGLVQVEGQQLKVSIPKSVPADKYEDVKAAMLIVGRLEFREVDNGSALQAVAKSVNEETGVKVVAQAWEDEKGLKHGSFVVEGPGVEAAKKALGSLPEGIELLVERGGDPSRVRLIPVKPAALKNDAVKSFSTPTDAYLAPEVLITFTETGARSYEELTGKLIGRKLATVVDGVVWESAAIAVPMSGGKASISVGADGDKLERQHVANQLAAALRGGELPAPLKLEDEKEVGR